MKNKILVISSLIIVILFVLSMMSCNNSPSTTTADGNKTLITHLTAAEFKDKIFDYTSSNDFKYKGTEPCIIDFYATWCGPCKRIAPVLEDLSVEYKGKIKIYKIDVDQEKDLAGAFGVESIPTIYFCPLGGKPRIEYGAIPKENLVEIINTTLLHNSITKTN